MRCRAGSDSTVQSQANVDVEARRAAGPALSRSAAIGGDPDAARRPAGEDSAVLGRSQTISTLNVYIHVHSGAH
jgi:hypothetical protein